MKPPHLLADRELLEYADNHIGYEVYMLVWTVGILGSVARIRDEGQLAWACNCALLESFSIHARNLIGFLYSRDLGKDWKTDIVVQDYVDEQMLANRLPPITPVLEQAMIKAHKQTAHLTQERIQYEQSGKVWNFIQIAKDIMDAFRAIAPLFPEARISESFRQQISQPKLAIPRIETDSYSKEGLQVGISFRVAYIRDGRDSRVVGFTV